MGGQIAIERGGVRFVDPHTVEVGGKRITGAKVLIATGSRPVVLEIPGLDAVSYLTSDLLTADEPVELRELPRSLLVIGGGYIALELGQMFARFGSAVTILERSGQLLGHGYEPELGRAIRDTFVREGVEMVTNASVLSVHENNGQVVATVSLPDGERPFTAERLLIATGRRPNSDQIEIGRAGVRTAEQRRGEIEVDQHLRTNVPHIFAAGDVIGSETGSQMATPVGSHDGRIAALNALSDGPPPGS